MSYISIDNMLRYANCGKNYDSEVGAWYTEHSGTTFEAISHLLMEWAEFSINRGIIDKL